MIKSVEVVIESMEVHKIFSQLATTSNIFAEIMTAFASYTLWIDRK